MQKHNIKQLNENEKPPSKTKSILLILFVLLYLISPIDFLPEFLPVLGIFDDVVVVIALITKLLKEFNMLNSSFFSGIKLNKKNESDKVENEKDKDKNKNNNSDQVIDGEVID